MKDNSTPRRYGVATVYFLFVVYILAASVMSLMHEHCRERTTELVIDGIVVGIVAALIQLLVMIRRSGRFGNAFSVYCVLKKLIGTHVRYGIAAGYVVGVSFAAHWCVFG